MRSLTIGQDAQQAPARVDTRPLAFLPRRGSLGRSLMFFAASVAALYFGATRLGLIGSPAYVDNSRGAHWLAAIFLVAGGVYFMSGWAAMWAGSGRPSTAIVLTKPAEETEPAE